MQPAVDRQFVDHESLEGAPRSASTLGLENTQESFWWSGTYMKEEKEHITVSAVGKRVEGARLWNRSCCLGIIFAAWPDMETASGKPMAWFRESKH